MLDAERGSLVRDALAMMEGSKTDLLIRKYVDGKTYGQLAEQMQIPAHVVEYRVTAARKCLRKLLIERGLGEDDLS